jgi:hypothetical protein
LVKIHILNHNIFQNYQQPAVVSQGYKSPSSYQTPRPNYQKPSAYSPTPNYQQPAPQYHNPAPQYPNNQQGFIKQNYSSLRNSTMCKIGTVHRG